MENNSSLTESQRLWCFSILGYLFNWNLTLEFRHPVDLEKNPDYSKIIKKPMDLEKLRTSFENGEYNSIDKFISDLDLIFLNAKTFYGKDHVMSIIADEILVYTRKQESMLNMSAEQLWMGQLKEIQEKIENHLKDMPEDMPISA